MIRKLRHKFIIILMTVVALILLAIFLSVLLSTWGNMRRMSENTLIQSLSMMQAPAPRRGGGGSRVHTSQQGPPRARTPVLVAALDLNGNISIITNQLHFIEPEDAEAIVRSAKSSPNQTGAFREDSLRWMKSGDGAHIAFVDMSMEEEMLRNLIVISLLVGGMALALFFFISLPLSRWAVRPVELAWERQRQFVADASHELKTPLTVILSNADMLFAEPFKDEKTARRIGHINAEAMHMKKLVEDMLTLAKSDSAEKPLVTERVDLSDIVTNAVLTFEPVAFDEQKSLSYDVQNGLFTDGDNQHLQQLVHILLDNACKYANVNGMIEVSLNKSGHQTVLLTVKNDGDAIPKEELERIFLRFYRLDSARSSPNSFGLGLSIAESIVREHNGKIWAESNAEMKNCFYVSLPLSSI